MEAAADERFIQETLKQCHFDVQFDVVGGTPCSGWRLGAKDPGANKASATNVTAATMDPFFMRFVSTKSFPSPSNNWGFYSNPRWMPWTRPHHLRRQGT